MLEITLECIRMNIQKKKKSTVIVTKKWGIHIILIILIIYIILVNSLQNCKAQNMLCIYKYI